MSRKTVKDKEAEFKEWESTPVYLTPEGLGKLQRQLEHLKQILPEITQEVGRTAAYGDRSDNAEYKSAKSRLRGTQRQIALIEDQLRKIKIIPSGPDASGKIRMGSTVIIESKEGKKIKLRIVGSKETNPPAGFISNLSPLGAALLGHATRETISFKTEAGTQEYRILKVY